MMRPNRLLLLLTLLSVPSSALASSVGIPWWAVHVSGIVIGLLGLFLSGLLFWRRLGPGSMLVSLIAVWLLVMPWFIVMVTGWITPGVHGNYHVHGVVDLLLRVWLPGNLVPVIAAGLACWLFSRLRAER